MGTSIDVLFARNQGLSDKDVTCRLTNCFSRVQSDLAIVQKNAWYSYHVSPWDVALVAEFDGEPEYLFAEGPYGFDISVFSHVICLGQLERFRRMFDPDSPVALPLQRIVNAVVFELAGPTPFIAVAAGMGDSDRAVGLAYYEAVVFDRVVESLCHTLGTPSRIWKALNDGMERWAMIDATKS